MHPPLRIFPLLLITPWLCAADVRVDVSPQEKAKAEAELANKRMDEARDAALKSIKETDESLAKHAAAIKEAEEKGAAIKFRQDEELAIAAKAKKEAEIAVRKRSMNLAQLRDFYADAKDRVTIEWMEEPEAETIWKSFRDAGYIPVLSEGKMDQGRAVFRNGFKYLKDTHPEADPVQWYCYFGVDQKFFDDTDRTLQDQKFARISMMSFENGAGEKVFCACWVKPTAKEEK